MTQPEFIFDIETNGLLHEADRVHVLAIRQVGSGTVGVYRGSDVENGVRRMKHLADSGALLIGHNAIKFDHPMLTKLYPDIKIPIDSVRDTMVISRVLYPDLWDRDKKLKLRGVLAGNLMNSHSLKAWGIRLGLHKGDYTGGWESWNQEMEDYCVQDTAVTEKLWTVMTTSKLYPQDGRAIDIEHQVAIILARQERYGFLFDHAKAVSLYATLGKKREELRLKLHEVFPPWWHQGAIATPTRDVNYRKNPLQAGTCAGAVWQKTTLVQFNPSSRAHIALKLKERYGWKPTQFTEGGEAQIDESILKGMVFPEARLLEEYFLIEKRIGQVAEGDHGWLKKVGSDGRMHGSVNPNGAVTCRMSHSHPNMGQVPASYSPYGKECRECFTVPPNRKLVGCDADALELRDLAGYMAKYDGGAYIKTVLEGDKSKGTDMHSVNARVIGLDPKALVIGKETGRDIAKRWFYAFIYGAGNEALGQIISGKSSGVWRKQNTAEGKRTREKFMANLPALVKLISSVQASAKKRGGYIKGLDGRFIAVRSDHAALNTLLQSAGAIQMKWALAILDQQLQEKGYVPSIDYEFVANVHDEWQLECRPEIADDVGKTAASAIALAGTALGFRCPLAGNYVVGNNWAETH